MDLTWCNKEDGYAEFVQGVKAQLWRSNALMVGNAVLVAIMVVINASGWRYRHYTVTRFLSLGASTLFLPIVSYVVSSIGTEYCKAKGMEVSCEDNDYVVMLLMWTVLVQIIGVNFSSIVAINDGEGQTLGPSIELLVRTLWTSYLVFYYIRQDLSIIYNIAIPYVVPLESIYSWHHQLSVSLIALCVLSLVKITLKLYAFEKARRSFALGRNPRIIAGYMEQLHGRPSEDEPITPLIVMGEEKQQIEERPHGYIINWAMIDNSLVTVDRVWRLVSTGDVLLAPRPQLKDLCLSFALFKLIRRRFARCRLAESGSTEAFNFVRDVLLSHGDPDRVFRVIADEVSFLGDSYYSSLPASYFGKLLPILNIIVSLSITIACCVAFSGITSLVVYGKQYFREQLICTVWCTKGSSNPGFGSLQFISFPTLFLLVSAILAEAWEIASYICSNWIKVTLICTYVTHASWQQSPCLHRCLGLVLKFRIKCIKSCSDQMGQVSLLPHRQPRTCGLRQKFFCFSAQRVQVQHVKAPREVKAAIVGMLISSNGSLSNGMVAVQNSGIGNGALWAFQGESTCDVILVWHIATGIFEARHTALISSSADGTVATYLSRYCVYLLEAAPELLPDDEAWSKKQFKAVRKDADHLFSAGSHKSVDYDQMIELLGERSDQHEVVKKGVRLGKQLVEGQDAETGWRVLARFWSEMILYVAASDNLKAHRETIARGGELVTLIWALLTNAGIITRPTIRTAV